MEKTVVKALKVLEMLARSPGPCSLSDVAAQCEMTKSNAHRLLQTLSTCNYVRQAPETRNYETTLRIWEFGLQVYDRFDIRGVAEPFLRQLHAKTRESVHLSILDGAEVIYLDKIDSDHAVRAYIRVGERAPAYCTSTGRAMLAYMDEPAIAAASTNMRKHTEKTIPSAAALRRELAKIRETGVSLTFGEWRAGVVGVAAPVRTEFGAVVAGVGVAGPPDRMDPDDLDPFIDAVTETARGLSVALGFGDLNSRVNR